IVSIAHRLSTVQDANEIVYIEYGKIKEKGSFNELIELKGAFYNLWILSNISRYRLHRL
ncbi:hypothetical protein Q604_UNBC06891G0001, partial [human gut metagenome]